uniref:DUF7086 domain-containing protein n=1 Tax=Kalanchoe fedtschenkoi TaxID=63787 RepID=A0A7N0ZZY2_KALFE
MVNGVVNMVNGVVNNNNVAHGQIHQTGALRNHHHPVHGGLGFRGGLAEIVATARPSRGCRATHPVKSGRKSHTIAPPHPWAMELRASVHPIRALTARGITAISGDMQCKRCEQPSRVEYNLAQQMARISNFVQANRDKMRDRAPIWWLNPALPRCPSCEHENSLKPVIAEKKRNINWLFLLLGEMLGCCTLEQLKYFCKHTSNHRTGAKDRVLYLTYLALCKQLDPTGPFDR